MLQAGLPFIQVCLTTRKGFALHSEKEPNLPIILNLHLSFIVETRTNMQRENLPPANAVGMILLQEYSTRGFSSFLLPERIDGEISNCGFSLINSNPGDKVLEYKELWCELVMVKRVKEMEEIHEELSLHNQTRGKLSIQTLSHSQHPDISNSAIQLAFQCILTDQ